MDIYFLDLNNFPTRTLDNFIQNCTSDISYVDKLKKYQHYAGEYLLKYTLKNEYEIENFETETINGKPFLKNLPYYYSISHSKNIIGLAIGDKPVGFDVEYNRTDRNFKRISRRYGCDINDKKEFYDFWTKREAKIKLGSSKENLFFINGIINNDFTYSVVCEEPVVIYNFKTINM